MCLLSNLYIEIALYGYLDIHSSRSVEMEQGLDSLTRIKGLSANDIESRCRTLIY